MSVATRDPAAIAAAVQVLLGLIATERQLVLGRLDDLTALALSADFADARADAHIRDALCSSLLDTAHDVLGDCDPVDHLCALLGYEET